MSFCIVFLGCQKSTEYDVVSKQQLKSILFAKQQDANCVWLYGRDSEYHYFSLGCPSKDNVDGSVVLMRENYKIAINKLKVLTNTKVSKRPFLAIKNASSSKISNIIIKW